ncbi:MAG TPA: prolipoprotein diacylglyceryl transferase family protein [Flavisolibacter sp.]|nr:prolipoprotein diacylglyceryl transferase family protein [Flavisolibacter sp.]
MPSAKVNFPISFHIGSTSISLHTVLEAAAFFTGFRYFIYLRKKQGDLYSSSSRISVIIGAIIGALLGSRLVGLLERPYELAQAASPLTYILSNKTVVGGFLGGLAGVELTKKLMGETKASGDLFVFPMILALIIGRLGCFTMGIYEETYGTASSLPWAMDLGDGLKRHPVTLYEIFYLFVTWTALALAKNKLQLRAGALFKLFMILYLAFRLLLDLIKPHYELAAGLSAIQLACAGGLLYYSPYILRPKKLLTIYA